MRSHSYVRRKVDAGYKFMPKNFTELYRRIIDDKTASSRADCSSAHKTLFNPDVLDKIKINSQSWHAIILAQIHAPPR